MKHLYGFNQITKENIDLRELSIFVIQRRKEFLPLLKYYRKGSIDVDKLKLDIENIIKGSGMNESLSDVGKIVTKVLKGLGILLILPYWAYKVWTKPFPSKPRSSPEEEERETYILGRVLMTILVILFILTNPYLRMNIVKNQINADKGVVLSKNFIKSFTVYDEYMIRGVEYKSEILIPDHYILKVDVDGVDQTWHIFDLERSDTIKVGSTLLANGDITQVGSWYERADSRVRFFPKDRYPR